MARPIEYRPEYVQKVEQYLRTCGREQTKLPKRVDVALLLDCNDDTLVEWEKKYPEFSAAIKKVDQSQMSELVDDGFFGGKEINAAMAIFLLKANHGLSEPNKLDITSKGDKLPTPILGGVSVIPGNDSDEEDKPANKTD